MTHKEIFSLLETEYNTQIATHGINRILGTFSIGLANYGFERTKEDLKFVTIYLPQFEELCTGAIQKNETLYDIRNMYNITDSISLELLFSRYSIINPKFDNLFKESLLMHREKIGQINRKTRLENAYERSVEAFIQKNYFEGFRISIAAKMYAEGKSCKDCFYIKDTYYTTLLLSCLKGQLPFSEDEINDILFTTKELIEDEPEYTDSEANSFLKTDVLNLMHAALNETVSIESFLSCLTPKETEAWKKLKPLLNDKEVTLSISKIINVTGISRPTWTSLLAKMKNNNIAEVQNLGAKGTSIQMLI